MAVTLYGYRYSVYTRIARMALVLRGVEHDRVEVDPFERPGDRVLARINPFHLVPVLDHDGFRLFETAAITRYVAAEFPGSRLIPADPKPAARMAQVIGIVDAHGYWPLVRQVFSHAVFRPLIGEPADRTEIAGGLRAARVVLRSLEEIAAEGLVLVPGKITLADLHLAPVIGYFTMAEQGRLHLAEYPALGSWWRSVSRHPAFAATDPGLEMLEIKGDRA